MSKENEPKPADGTSRPEKMRAYRRDYWDRFKQTRKRVYGTLTTEQYAEVERRADEAGRAVWTQIHAEAEAYARGEYLPPKNVEEQFSELIAQLRRVGNNVNQIAKAVNTDGSFDAEDYVRNLEELEVLIQDFLKRPWAKPPDKDEAS